MKTILSSRKAFVSFRHKMVLLACCLFISANAQESKQFFSDDFKSNKYYKSSDFIPLDRSTVMCETHIDPLTGEYQPFVTKLDSDGDPVWGYLYPVAISTGAGNKIFATSIKVLANNDLLVGGVNQKLSSNSVMNELFLMRLDANGILLWFERYQPPSSMNFDKAVVAELSTGELIIASSSAANNNYVFIKTDNAGLSPVSNEFPLNRTNASLEDLHIDGTDIYAIGSAGHDMDYYGAMAMRLDGSLNKIWANIYVPNNSFGATPTDITLGATYRSNMVFKGITDGNLTSTSYPNSSLLIAGYMDDADVNGENHTFSKGIVAEINKNGMLIGFNAYAFNSRYSALYDIHAYRKNLNPTPLGVLYTTDYVMSGAIDIGNAVSSGFTKNIISTFDQYTIFNQGEENGIYNIFGIPESVLVTINPPAYQQTVSMIGTGSGNKTSMANKVYWTNPNLFFAGDPCLPFYPATYDEPLVSQSELVTDESILTLFYDDVETEEVDFTQTLHSLCEDEEGPCADLTYDVISMGGGTITTPITISTPGATGFSYTINYGDGSFPYTSPFYTFFPHVSSPNYTFTEPGTYTVCITALIFGDQVTTCTKCKTIIIPGLMLKQPDELLGSKEPGIAGSTGPMTAVTGVDGTNTKANIYPNPTTGGASVVFENVTPGPVTIGIYSINGQLVKQVIAGKTLEAGQQQIYFDLKDLSAGMYYCKIEGNSINVVKPVIKQ